MTTTQRSLMFAMLLALSATFSVRGTTNDNRGFRVDGTQAKAQQQQGESGFVVRLAYPFDWTWFEIDKPWSWEFVDEKDIDRSIPHKRRIPYGEAQRGLDNKVLVQYEYDLTGLTNVIVRSSVRKERFVIVVHPGFDDEKAEHRKKAQDFKNMLLSLGFQKVTFQRGLSLTGDWPLDPFTGTNTEVQQIVGGDGEPAPQR